MKHEQEERNRSDSRDRDTKKEKVWCVSLFANTLLCVATPIVSLTRVNFTYRKLPTNAAGLANMHDVYM